MIDVLSLTAGLCIGAATALMWASKRIYAAESRFMARHGVERIRENTQRKLRMRSAADRILTLQRRQLGQLHKVQIVRIIFDELTRGKSPPLRDDAVPGRSCRDIPAGEAYVTARAAQVAPAARKARKPQVVGKPAFSRYQPVAYKSA